MGVNLKVAGRTPGVRSAEVEKEEALMLWMTVQHMLTKRSLNDQLIFSIQIPLFSRPAELGSLRETAWKTSFWMCCHGRTHAREENVSIRQQSDQMLKRSIAVPCYDFT